jgi:hypothetical protein
MKGLHGQLEIWSVLMSTKKRNCQSANSTPESMFLAEIDSDRSENAKRFAARKSDRLKIKESFVN